MTNCLSRAPPNCYFQVDDFESPWDFWDFSKPFDLIHAGSLAGSVKDVPNLLQQAKRNLNPGGWFEFVDFIPEGHSDDDTLKDAKHFCEWAKLLHEASNKFGKKLNVVPLYKQWMIDAGYKDVTERIYKVHFASFYHPQCVICRFQSNILSCRYL